MKTALIGALFLETIFFGVESFDLGALIPLCSTNDPKLNECIKESGQKLITHLAKGIPELNVPPLDPMILPKMVFQEEDGDMKIDITYTDVAQTGLSTIVIDNVTIDIPNNAIAFNLTNPIFTFIGDYEAQGNVLGIVFTGKGKCNITCHNTRSNLYVKFSVKNDHVVDEMISVYYIFDKVFLDYSNLVFEGSHDFDSTIAFINENALQIMNTFKPSLEKYYSALLRDALKGIFEIIPYSSLMKTT